MTLRLILVLSLAVVTAPAAVLSQHWKFSLDIVASYASGNTDSSLISIGLRGDREVDKDILAFALDYDYAAEDGESTSDAVTGKASWRRLINDRSYLGMRFDGEHDDLAGIDYRFRVTGFYGHFLVKNDKTRLSFEGGPGWTVEDTGMGNTNFFTFYTGEKFTHEVNEHTSIFQNLSFFVPLDDFDNFQIVLDAGLETKLTENLNFRASIENRYENVPAPGKTENDFRFVSGVSVKF